MSTPFPGMDPYLEQGGLWKEIHTMLIAAITRALSPQLPNNYRVAVEQRTYLAIANMDSSLIGEPDVLLVKTKRPATTAQQTITAELTIPQVVDVPLPEEIVERYLVVRNVISGEAITVIELLSPTNKSGVGRAKYERKRLKILGSDTHLIEIDLLRQGKPLPFTTRSQFAPTDYRILVSRAAERPQAELYGFGIRDQIPVIPVPLRSDELEPTLNLTELLHEQYDFLRIGIAIDYSLPLNPALSVNELDWVQTILQKRLD